MAAEPGEDDFETQSNAFLTWLQQSGTTISPQIALVDLRGQSAGRGVVATTDIAEDEELFSIPRNCILTTESSSLPNEINSQLDDPWLSLILAMTYEAQLGGASTWKAYFDVLPQEFDTLMYWSATELSHLKGSAIADKIGKLSADQTFTERLIPLVRQNQDIFSAAQLHDTDLLTLFHRMGSTIMAYAFDLEDPRQPPQTSEDDGWEEDSDAGGSLPKGMVPLADMLNADGDRNNAKLFYEENKVVMKTVAPVKKGEELFNDYGPLPRADVLRRYGYITENYAQYDVVEISLDLVKEVAMRDSGMGDGELDDTLGYLDEQGLVDDGYDIGRRTNENGQIPEELAVLVNGLSLSEEDFAKLRSKDRLPKAELSGAGAQLLHHVLQRRKEHYGQGPDDVMTDHHGDDDLAKGKEMHRKSLARSVIVGELQVISEGFDLATSILAKHDSKRKASAEEDIKPSPKKQKKI